MQQLKQQNVPPQRVLTKKYGKYQVTIKFADEDVPGADKDLLSAIIQAYVQRMERQFQEL